MKRGLQGALLVLIGVVVLGVVLSGQYLLMVREQMYWPLLATGLVLVTAGGTLLDLARREDGHPTPRIGMLLAAPFLAMVAIPVAPLSAWTAERSGNVEVAPVALFDPLPADNPLELKVPAFVQRASYDPEQSLKGRTVRLTGFVTRHGSTWSVTRMHIMCCAADAKPFKADVVSAPAPAENSWVEVIGTWVPAPVATPGSAPWPKFQATSVKAIPTPKNPYQ